MKHLKYPSISVHFDGTLTYWNEETYPHINPKDIRLDAIRTLVEYRKLGGKVVLFTCRTDSALQIAIKTCEDYGLVFDSVNSDLQLAIDSWREKYPNASLSPKPWTTLTIDDKAWPCNTRGLDWGQIARDILQFEE
jgi:hypothetical protein